MSCNCNDKKVGTQYIGDVQIDTSEKLPDYILAEKDVEDELSGDTVRSLVRIPTSRLISCDGDIMRFSFVYTGGENPDDWTVSDVENGLAVAPFGYRHIANFTVPTASFMNEETQEEVGPDEIFSLLESGKRIILDNVPLGVFFPYDEGNEMVRVNVFVDGVELSNKVTENLSESPDPILSYSGGAFVHNIDASAGGNYLGIAVHKDPYDVYWVTVQGFGHFHSNN